MMDYDSKKPRFTIFCLSEYGAKLSYGLHVEWLKWHENNRLEEF